MRSMPPGVSPHPALPFDVEPLIAADLDEILRADVDSVDEAAVAAVSEALDRASRNLAGPRATSPPAEASAQRAAVDLEVVIPAYNESGRLPATLTAMVAFLSEQPWTSRVVVVDNGSADDTASAVLSAANGTVDAVAIGCSRPGKGAAVYRGMRTSRSRWVGFTDSDLSTPLETFHAVVAALQDGATAAIASRNAPGAHRATKQGLGRRVGGAAFRLASRPLLPGIHDTQCGFKFFDRAAMQAALWRSRSTGFAFDVELLRHIRDDGGRIVEIPVTWTDAAGSSLRPVRDGVAAFSAVAKLHRDLTRHSSRSRPSQMSSSTVGGRP
jgi:dolichyl-phosphate beta-glucosyltransferase